MDIQLQTQKQTLLGFGRSISSDSGIGVSPRSSWNSNTLSNHTETTSNTSNDALLKNVLNFRDSSDLLSHKILSHLLNHLFENLFVKLPESSKRNILTEIWNLIPREIIFSLTPTPDWWSKQGIFEAIMTMEITSSDDFCTEVLNTLINFKKEPCIIDITIGFLEQNYHAEVYVSKASQRLLAVPKETPELQSYATGTLSKHLMIPYRYSQNFEIERKSVYCTSRLKQWKTEIVYILVAITVLVATSSFVTYILGYMHQRNSADLPKSFHLPGSSKLEIAKVNHSMSVTSMPKVSVALPRYSLVVTSYDEYKNGLFRLMYDREVSLEISLETDENWPTDFPAGNTHMIKELRVLVGSSVQKLFSVLNAMKNANNVTIVNTNNLVCTNTEQYYEFYQDSINLPNVQTFSLEGFQECLEFYNLISQSLVLYNMQTFRAVNCVVTNQNSDLLTNFVSKSRDHINTLEFSKCDLQAPILTKNLGTFLQLKVLKLDFLGDGSIVHVDSNINRMFPYLEELISNDGFIDWDQFLYFSECKSLRHAKVGIAVNAVNDSISLLPLLNDFRQLKSLDLSLNFVNRDGESGCKVIGFKEVDKFLNDFRFRSNCHTET